ncbi:hypothetical protein [Burkholderia anthina]|uniref:hypothetical protein n=1 Tax=Burkholderia anthina TaxID=179879 RepID=UPI001AA06E65|nr:hypothetical protein [Burkholderia anthina]QTD91747.1 hypothetical protein J4G50_26185 [Burkholderia anthina]
MIDKENPENQSAESSEKPLHCGLVMPISASAECPAEHWSEVRSIITDAIESIPNHQFDVAMVSESDGVGIIHKSIVQNLYNADIVICDVSTKNPNVMFELGMRLAFDKPTIIIKDDKTDYSFDTSPIEHIGYPRDLRFGRMVDFKKTLQMKVIGTRRQSIAEEGYSPFLGNFGKFTSISLEQTKLSTNEAIATALNELQSEVAAVRVLQRREIQERMNPPEPRYPFGFEDIRYLVDEFKKEHPNGAISTSNTEFMDFLGARLGAKTIFPDPWAFERYIQNSLNFFQIQKSYEAKPGN